MSFDFLLVGELIRQNLCVPPTRLDMCQHFGLTEYQLLQGFKRTHGTTLGRYLRRQRMHKAAKLLLGGNETVLSIAGSVGFRNSSRFAEAFRCEYGINPRQFRKTCGQELTA